MKMLGRSAALDGWDWRVSPQDRRARRAREKAARKRALKIENDC